MPSSRTAHESTSFRTKKEPPAARGEETADNMTDKTSIPPAAKRVRWDDSVPHDPEQPVRAMVSSEAADPVSAEPSCNANDAIRLYGGENCRALLCAVCGTWFISKPSSLYRTLRANVVMFSIIPGSVEFCTAVVRVRRRYFSSVLVCST